MHILLVDDNRDVLNWGCRATSISLARLLSDIGQIGDTIDKKTVDGRIAIGLESLQRRGIWRLRNYLVRAISQKRAASSLFGAATDFVTPVPTESVANLLKHKDRTPSLDSIYEKVSSADIVVINGEGSMIFTTPPRRDLLFQLMIVELTANYFQKPVFYLNAMMSDCPAHGRNGETARSATDSLLKCAGVTFRDHYSVRLCNEINPQVDCQFVPDALFSWFGYMQESQAQLPQNGDFLIPFPERDEFFGKYDFHTSYVCLGGSSLAAWSPGQAIEPYCCLVQQLIKLGTTVYLVETCSGDRFLRDVSARTGVPIILAHIPILMGGAILANARLLVSGRYHASILAALGGTPCIFLGSNSHKTRSLQEVLEYDVVKEFSAVPSHEESVQIGYLAKDILGKGQAIRRQIKTVSARRCEETTQILDITRDGVLPT